MPLLATHPPLPLPETCSLVLSLSLHTPLVVDSTSDSPSVAGSEWQQAGWGGWWPKPLGCEANVLLLLIPAFPEVRDGNQEVEPALPLLGEPCLTGVLHL